MPSERTRELVEAVALPHSTSCAKMQRSKFGANARAEQIAQGCTCARREKIAALLSHYADLEGKRGEEKAEYHKAMQMYIAENRRLHERIAKMQAAFMLSDVRMLRLYSGMFDGERHGDFASLADRIEELLDALPSSTEESLQEMPNEARVALDVLAAAGAGGLTVKEWARKFTERIAAIARPEINRAERASYD